MKFLTRLAAFTAAILASAAVSAQTPMLIHSHNDRGFQYTSKTFHQKLMDAGMRQSMSRVGRCIDNGPMEGYWGILKSEMYYLRKFTDREDLIKAIENYIHFYNTKRYQFKLHCMTPMEFHAAFAA